MAKNMGTMDRGLRIAIALVLLIAAFGWAPLSAGALHWLAILVAVVFLVTSVVGMCPLYRVVGLKTCRDC